MPLVRTLFTTTRTFAVLMKSLVRVVLLFVFLVLSSVSLATAEVIHYEDMNHTYIINASMMDNLNALTGKRVTVFLDGGKVLTGIVKSVGSHLVHLQKAERKEVFDVLIRIKHIQAIEVLSREYQKQ